MYVDSYIEKSTQSKRSTTMVCWKVKGKIKHYLSIKSKKFKKTYVQLVSQYEVFKVNATTTMELVSSEV
ncbi:unnamed protein product [Cunninghamella blakesleeana]